MLAGSSSDVDQRWNGIIIQIERGLDQFFDGLKVIGMPRVCNEGRMGNHANSVVSQVLAEWRRNDRGVLGELSFAEQKLIVWSQLIRIGISC